MKNLPINHRKNIEKRNQKFLKDEFSLEVSDWIENFKILGPPDNKYEDFWNINNPTRSWCGGVTSALRLCNKVPANYIPCRNRIDPHYYFVNPKTNEVIDLTIYQMADEYEFDYLNYNQNFMNVLSKTIKKIISHFKLQIDNSKFEIKKVNGVDYIKKR
jgi:hypothetical protein